MDSKSINEPEFSQAENLTARIKEVLWRRAPLPETDPSEPCTSCDPDAVRRALREIPECRKFAENPPAENIHKACQELAVELAIAERKHPKEVEQLESVLFQPVPFEQVWSEELDEIARLREARAAEAGKHPAACRIPQGKHLTVTQRAYDARLFGLCFSGGGVRSATFNLGILQGMAKHRVLEKVDYLSTVSGGGYIGGWLAAWIKRKGFDSVQKGLCCEDQSQHEPIETEPISFLRDYSSYLTPRNGIFTADTWTAATIWLRNTLLNLIVLLSFLAALMLAPHVPEAFMNWRHDWQHDVMFAALAIVCQITLIINVARNLKEFAHADESPSGEFGDSLRRVQLSIILPSLLSSWFCASLLWNVAHELPLSWGPLACIGAIVAVCFSLLVYVQYSCGYVRCYLRTTKETKSDRLVAHSLCFVLPMIPTAVKAVILWGIFDLFRNWARSSGDLPLRNVMVWGIPLILAGYSLCITIHIGLMGRYLLDVRREWWSRVAAYVGIYAVAIWALSSACLYGPFIADIPWPKALWGAPLMLWVAVTCTGLIAVTSRTAAASLKAPLFSMLITSAPYVFMVGLFVSVSWALDHVLHPTAGLPALGFCILAAAIAYVMARTVDVNEFSMHHFYRNRLTRTYLGASRTRRPNRLTGFDAGDDLLLASLRPVPEPGLHRFGRPYTGPYPILNATLNLAHGDRLARQERKAASFVFTPRFCGYDYRPARYRADRAQTANGRPHGEAALRNAGYRPTAAYAYPDGGVHLGTAMAISGAATAPNAGRYTSTPLAFLLTVFNIRLGWWMGNPRHDESWRRAGPHGGLAYFASELFGRATDRKKHVYLSDGGHFENLGIYELVRRHCSLIIACDAEEDAHSEFSGLGDAIRKSFIDFGVRIKVNLDDLRPDAHTRFSKKHYVVGEIHYPEGVIGTLIYIKASMTGADEPADLLAYRAKHACFPHQSTTEQFFEESQFESYHRLGLHIGKDVFANWNSDCEWKDPREPGSADHRMSSFPEEAYDHGGANGRKMASGKVSW